MRAIKATLTAQGQVTIPIEIRRLLGIKPHDNIAFIRRRWHGALDSSDQRS